MQRYEAACRAKRARGGGCISAVLMVSVSACAGTSGDEIQSSPTSANSASVSDGGGLSETESYLAEARTISLEAYAALPIEDDQVLWRTTQLLVEQCMEDGGFSYPVEPYPTGVGNLDTVGAYPDSDLVAAYGYLWVDHREIGVPPTPPAASITDPDFQERLGMCFIEADGRIGRDELEIALAPFYDAASEMSVSINLEPEVQESIARWVSCMSVRGYEVSDLRSAEDLASANGTAPMDSKFAVEVAVADFGCQEESELLESQRVARQRTVTEWIDAHPSALHDRDEAIENILDRCLELLND